MKVVDEIAKRHPSYGVKNGWSHYTGGMADTGNWYYRKMIDEPIETLQSFLNKLVRIENLPPKPPVNQKEATKKFFEEIERRLLWGK